MRRVSEKELERRFELACRSHLNEAQFFAHLLAAMVYVHAPLSDDSKNLRLIQFRHPNGFDAIPFFTSARRSARAASTSVRVVHLSCLDLLKSTRGATLMVNPNDGGAVLYPEEVATLLERGTLRNFEKLEAEDRPCDIRSAESPPAFLVDALRTGVASTPFIRCLYLLDKRLGEEEQSRPILLIYLGADSAHMERAARHVMSLVHRLDHKLDRIIDVAVYDAAGARPEFLVQIGAAPVFGVHS